jgi:predicted  nucleic acid-binding Zn-ribbon protein
MKNAILMTLVLSAGLLAARAPAQTALNTEAVTLRKELADLQFAALNSAEGEARLEARRQADRAFRDAAAQIPEFKALEAERAQLLGQLKALSQRQAALEAKYAQQLASQIQARDAAAQQVRTLTSGGARGDAIKARLAVVAPAPAAK